MLCDRRFNATHERRGEFQFLIGFAAARAGGVSQLSHRALGAAHSRVTPASLNRAKLAELCPEELKWVDALASQLAP